MKPRLKLFAHASIVSVFLTGSILAGADEARVKVAGTETSQQTIGRPGEQQGPPRRVQVAQQCQTGRDDCMTRPQEQCGPGLDGCLSLGQANCKDDTVGPNLSPPTPNTAAIEKALANPNLPPEQRAKFENMKAAIEASRHRGEQMRSRVARIQSSRCLADVVKQCRASHC
jgi:hypothetical protein